VRIDVITGFPRLLASPLAESILKRAQDKGLVQIHVHDLREYTADKHRSIDDAPYGGGAGMVLKMEPIAACVDHLKSERDYDEFVLTAAHGERLTQRLANTISLKQNILILCGHYKGIDQRVSELYQPREVSIGDYVLTGGELPACVLIDAVVRLIPGVLHDGESLLDDSFQDDLLGAPCYTRPPDFRGLQVPDVLLNGNHAEISRWRLEQREERTSGNGEPAK
jgi:tRNA (guanine37-N1)-methyltransferase